MTYVPLHHPYFQDDHPVILDEMVYKDIMIAVDPRDLPYRDYAPLVKYVKYIGMDDDIMKFYVPSPTPEKYPEMAGMNLWTTYIQLLDLSQVVDDLSLTPTEAARLAFWNLNLRVHCGCPAYLYYGMRYIDTQLGIAMFPEKRFPSIRNPELKGLLCKHLIRTFRVFPFHLGDIAAGVKQKREQ